MGMVVGNTHFRKRDSHLVTHESGGCRTQVDYCLFRTGDRKLVKVIPCEECIAQHRAVVCDLSIKEVKKVKRKFIPRRKV